MKINTALITMLASSIAANIILAFMCHYERSRFEIYREMEIAITLPDEVRARPTTQPRLIVINVQEDGACRVDNKEMSLEELAILVGESLSANPDQKVLIRGDRNARHKHVADAVGICRDAGIDLKNIGFDYIPDTGTEQ
ncbi:MAG: biopolymer transporter ExbD [Phycisphaerae bacterium]|jgi:biopolymer transport protein ExbD|nr:biopolymer transporter ExbD [Phycisphaerae bacterium]